MQIIVQFEDQLMAEYRQGGRPSFFRINWENNGTHYPSKDWLDFGAVVLGWWLVAARSLIDGSEHEIFMFMDGPYSVHAAYDRNADILKLMPSRTSHVWTIRLGEFVSALIAATREVDRKLRLTPGDPQESAALAKGISDLEMISS